MAFHDLITTTALAAHFADVRAGSAAAGADGLRPDDVAADLARYLAPLSAALADGSWRPGRLLRLHKPKPTGGVRRLAIPTVTDRIVIALVRRVVEPAVEPLLARSAYAYRPGRSARGAVDAVLSAIERGARHVALADVREFFDSIALGPLHEAMAALPIPSEIKAIARRLLDGHALAPGRGLAQGSALSPALSNLAMVALDRAPAFAAAGRTLVRYCDNLCVTAETEADARDALGAMQRAAGRLGLRLKDAASEVVDVARGFSWLGFWIGDNGLSVSEGAVAALCARLADAGRGHHGDALRARLEPIVRGWASYFDAPLPPGLSLGEHDELVRTMLGRPARAEAATPSVADDTMDDPWRDATEAPSDQASALLDDADRRAAAGDFAGAEASYAAAERAAAEQAAFGAARATEPAARASWDDEALDGFLGLFAAGQEQFEVAAERDRARFTTVARPPSANDARDHLDGISALAVRALLADGTAALGVLDLDARDPTADVAVAAHASALAAVARGWGIAGLLETTGGRGYHLWIPVDGRVAEDTMAALLESLCRTAGPPPTGVTVERMPAGSGAPDLRSQACTLPLGLHAETGRPSRLTWVDGPEVVADGAGGLAGLFAHAPNRPDVIAAHARAAPRAPDAPPTASRSLAIPTSTTGAHGAVARVLAGCAVLRHLEDKAAASGHLSHPERLSVLYSLGHLGATGEQAIHRIVGRCANYDRGETDRQIGRLSGLPIGCTRLREKHATPELLPSCACDFGDVRRRGGYPTPLLHAAGFRRSWRDVLRGRREEATEIRDQHARDPVAVVVPAEPDAEATALTFAAPPHEWA